MSRLLIEPVTPMNRVYRPEGGEYRIEFQHAAQAGRELAAG